MLMPATLHHRPKNFSDLAQLTRELAEAGHTWHFLAGGTDLIPNLKQGNFGSERPVSIVSLNNISELSGIEFFDGMIEIGATTKLSEIGQSSEVREHLPALATTVNLVGTGQIRNMASLGGNIMVDSRCRYYNQPCHVQESNGICFKSGGGRCHVFPMTKVTDPLLCRARFVSDSVPVLLLLNSEVVISNGIIDRTIELSELFREDGLIPHKLGASEFIRSVRVSAAGHDQIIYEKLRIRQAIDFPSLGIAGQIIHGGSMDRLRFSVTGVGMIPSLIELEMPAQAEIEDKSTAVAYEIKKVAKPLEQDFFSTGYRRTMIFVMVRKIIRQLQPLVMA